MFVEGGWPLFLSQLQEKMVNSCTIDTAQVLSEINHFSQNVVMPCKLNCNLLLDACKKMNLI